MLIALTILLLVRAPLDAQQDSPWSFLQDFGFVQGAVSPVQGGYVAAVLYDSAKNLFALVIYPGECRTQSCAVKAPVAFFVVDSEGLLVKHHVEPGAELASIIPGLNFS